MQPRTQYVKGPEGHVAYQVLGSGSRDIVFVPDHPNNIEIMWENPALSRFLERLATMGRVICFDKRGTGISDPVPARCHPDDRAVDGRHHDRHRRSGLQAHRRLRAW